MPFKEVFDYGDTNQQYILTDSREQHNDMETIINRKNYIPLFPIDFSATMQSWTMIIHRSHTIKIKLPLCDKASSGFEGETYENNG